MDIKKAIDRNIAVNNIGYINPDLEIAMLQEELSETAEALKKGDLIESVDWLIDIIFVAIGTMYKLWLSSDKITACRDEVCRSNDSKLPFTKWEDGKVKKWPNYTRPDLGSILRNHTLSENQPLLKTLYEWMKGMLKQD